MKRVLLIILLQLGLTSICAQNYKFGKVSKEELQEKFNPADSSANATVLYSSEKIEYEYDNEVGFYVIKDIHKRIKIYNKEGLEWAKHAVRMYDKSSALKENLSALRGITYNLINGEVKEQKLKKDGIFKEKENEYWKKTTFTLPSVTVGSVIEFKYVVKSYYASKLDDVLLQELIPIKKLVYQVTIPEYYNFKLHPNLKSNLNPKIDYDSSSKEIIVKWRDKRPGPGGIIRKHESLLDYSEKIIRVNEENIPGLKKEIYVANLNNYKSKLSFELVSTKSFGSKITNYANNWNSVVEKIYKSENFGEQLIKNDYFKKDVDVLLQSLKANSDKITAIYNSVKSKVKWNDFIGIYTDNGVKKAYNSGVGNVADINLMLISMLRYAGVNANPILISTKSNGIPLFPTRQGFNYVLCGVEINNEIILLDATEENTTVNIVPERVLNWQGRMIRANGSSNWVDLYPKKNSNNTTMISTTLNDDLFFTGKMRNQQTDYYAYEYRNEYVGVESESLMRDLSKDKGELQIADLEVKNVLELGKPVQQVYNFTYEDGVEEIGSEVYVSPMLFLTQEDNVFNKEDRSYPIDFSFPRSNKNIINLTIPNGYKVKSIPESVKLVMSDGVGEYSYLVKQMGNTIQVSEALKINFPIIAVMYYPELREVYKKMIEKNGEKIVLEKI
ncbi:MAG: transglutaminase [Kordia sp.]|nr:MAG: transglutaminase [Kordia sp.]